MIYPLVALSILQITQAWYIKWLCETYPWAVSLVFVIAEIKWKAGMFCHRQSKVASLTHSKALRESNCTMSCGSTWLISRANLRGCHQDHCWPALPLRLLNITVAFMFFLIDYFDFSWKWWCQGHYSPGSLRHLPLNSSLVHLWRSFGRPWWLLGMKKFKYC